MDPSFQYMANVIQLWLEGARLDEIVRVLRLIGEELGRRGFSFVWYTAPPMREHSLQ